MTDQVPERTATGTNTLTPKENVSSATKLAQVAAQAEKSASSATQHVALALDMRLMTVLTAGVEPNLTPTTAAPVTPTTDGLRITENASNPHAYMKDVMPATRTYAFTVRTDGNLLRISNVNHATLEPSPTTPNGDGVAYTQVSATTPMYVDVMVIALRAWVKVDVCKTGTVTTNTMKNPLPMVKHAVYAARAARIV